MNTMTILQPGLLTTIQDEGRKGNQGIGISPGGSMDMESAYIANLLVDNDPGEAVLEITIVGPVIEFHCAQVIAITGADLSPVLDGKPVRCYAALAVYPGQRLSFGGRKNGCRSYIAFAGGLDTPVVLDSRSTLLRNAIGGIEGRPLKKGDCLKFANPRNILPNMALRYVELPEWQDEAITLRVIGGPEEDRFSEDGIRTFYSERGFTLSNQCDRQGYRLEGEPVGHKNDGDILSNGIVRGAIQVPNNGLPIILMAEHQTIGGYAKIAVVITADFPLAAQCMPGIKVCFKRVTLEEARNAFLQRRKKLRRLSRRWKEEAEDGKEYTVTVNGVPFYMFVKEVGK